MNATSPGATFSSVRYTELAAPPPLDQFVRCFWFLSGYDPGDATQPVVADGRLEIVLHLAAPFSRIEGAGRAAPQSCALVSGQLTRPVLLRANGTTDIVGIRFRTAAARAILPVPPAELTNRIEPLADIAPALSQALLAAASRSQDPGARVAALAAVLVRHVTRTPGALAIAAIRSLDAPHAPTVGAVAKDHGVSARTLERHVLEHAGLPPSTLRRVLRFRRAFQLLDRAEPRTWGAVAARAGYFDQAHLVRDFREFAGASPTEFFRIDPTLARAILSGGDA